MNDRRLTRLLADAIELLERVQPALPVRLNDIAEARNGWPSGAAGGSSLSESDSTGNAAIRPDRARTDRESLERALVSIGRQAEDVVNILARYTPRPASDRERLATIADNERTDGCVSCARLEVARGVARWEPVSRGDLCRWCDDWRRQTGTVPPASELELHHRGLRVRRPA